MMTGPRAECSFYTESTMLPVVRLLRSFWFFARKLIGVERD